jgi:hypothetical protein
MNERREDAPLSTADMVSAARQQTAAPTQPGARDDRDFVQQGARTDGQATRTNGSTDRDTAC